MSRELRPARPPVVVVAPYSAPWSVLPTSQQQRVITTRELPAQGSPSLTRLPLSRTVTTRWCCSFHLNPLLLWPIKSFPAQGSPSLTRRQRASTVQMASTRGHREIYPRYTRDTAEIQPRYGRRAFKVSARYTRDTPRDITEIRPRYTRDTPEIRTMMEPISPANVLSSCV